MQKIPTLFVRDPETMSRVTEEVTPGCEWVMEGDGVATEKFDGTCCLIKDGEFYKRHKLKEGKPMPTGWLHWSFDPEQKSGHGWLPVVDGQPENRHHMEGFLNERNLCWDKIPSSALSDGTYELVGPKIQRNPYGLTEHRLWRHGSREFDAVGQASDDSDERTFFTLMAYIELLHCEGIVFHHPDGRMAKIKRRDFGFQWPMRRA